jgi:phosphate starvation-inducible PhoH-like protein
MSSTNAHIARTYDLTSVDQRYLFGQNSIYLHMIENEFAVKLIARGDQLQIDGEREEVDQVERLLDDLIMRLEKGHALSERYMEYAMSMIREEGQGPAAMLDDKNGAINSSLPKLQQITPQTVGQKAYLEAIDRHDIVFSIGPAGTGKTFLAVSVAVAELKAKKKSRIILVRPVVEAGESLGFLPGDIKAKVDPYLRPVYDALHDLMTADKISKMIELGIIEIAPLAYMRGRTLNNAFVILDEAQNTTVAQMKMFLTRLGQGSKAIITGDITQIDLARNQVSGLVRIQDILAGLKEISFVYLTEKDVVRHRLVQQIIKAYEKYEKRHGREGRKK